MNEQKILDNQKKIVNKLDVIYKMLDEVLDCVECAEIRECEEKLERKQDDIKFDIEEIEFKKMTKSRTSEKYYNLYHEEN